MTTLSNLGRYRCDVIDEIALVSSGEYLSFYRN